MPADVFVREFGDLKILEEAYAEFPPYENRLEQVDFSEIYMTAKQVIIVRSK